jgi:hypothetical protein
MGTYRPDVEPGVHLNDPVDANLAVLSGHQNEYISADK